MRHSDGALLYANPALSKVLGSEPYELEGAVAELVRGGRTNVVELAHPELGMVRLVVVPRDTARAAERRWHRDLRRELARARRRGWPLTVGAVALDAGGGTQAAAVAWANALRAEDGLSAYEEGIYLLVLPDCPAEATSSVAARLREATPAPATLSIGFTTCVLGDRVDAVTKRALRALADARAAGSSQTVIAPSPTTAGRT